MKVKYNAPVVLTFAIVSAAVMLLSVTLIPNLNFGWFMVPGRDHFSVASFGNWIRLFTHVAGHADWGHLINNFTLILILGPMLEENYGSFSLFIMILITALVTGALNVIFFRTALLGASGVVFMMILLASFTNFAAGQIPLTFILVMILYIGGELLQIPNEDNISQFAHIIGGLCGSFFGFLRPPRKMGGG
ncbi:MAG: rhomboid family intramembrane serine protease [Spirochaetes bacterium]|nr:rhomboid family intramembrane serine protease [Spirochaetota bacterium]